MKAGFSLAAEATSTHKAAVGAGKPAVVVAGMNNMVGLAVVSCHHTACTSRRRFRRVFGFLRRR